MKTNVNIIGRRSLVPPRDDFEDDVEAAPRVVTRVLGSGVQYHPTRRVRWWSDTIGRWDVLIEREYALRMERDDLARRWNDHLRALALAGES